MVTKHLACGEQETLSIHETITVTGIDLTCTCGAKDFGGALSTWNHAVHHGGAFIQLDSHRIFASRENSYVDRLANAIVWPERGSN